MIKKVALFLLSFCFAAQAYAFEFIFSYTAGKYISLDTGYATVGVFTPYAKTDWLTFVDLQAHYFENHKWGSNIGIGGRFMHPCYGALGLNAYWDYLEGRWGGHFHQVGIGLELLNPCWELRLNGYFPIGRHSHFRRKCFFSNLGDGFMAARGRTEYAYVGVDLEAGIPLRPFNNWYTYGAIGPYFYESHERKRHFYGAKVRFVANYGYFFAELKVSRDRVYKTRFQGTLSLQIPLEVFLCLPPCGCDWFVQPVYRNNVILTDRCCSWSWNW